MREGKTERERREREGEEHRVREGKTERREREGEEHTE